ARALHLGNQRSVVLFARRVRLIEGFLHACAVERLASFIGKAFAVGSLVVENGNSLAREISGHEFSSDDALSVITAANPVSVPQTLLGEFGVGRSRRDLEDPFLGIDCGSGDRRPRAEVTNDEFYALRSHLIGDSHGLFRVAGVVADFNRYLLSADAPRCIDIADGLFDTALQLFAE